MQFLKKNNENVSHCAVCLFIYLFQVFSHTNLESVTNDVLWDVARGLEEFNTIVAQAKETQLPDSVSFSVRNRQLYIESKLQSRLSNNVSNILLEVNPLHFTELLRMVACERSKYAAAIAYKYFISNRQFRETVNSRLPPVDWQPFLGLITQEKSKKVFQNESSDYYSATNSCSNSSSGSTDLQLSAIIIDISEEMSPLPDFGKREQGFVLKFFDVVSQCTNFIRNPGSQTRKPANNKDIKNGNSAKKEKVRSVHWGDACDPSVKVTGVLLLI